jgi:hypothetical protein
MGVACALLMSAGISRADDKPLALAITAKKGDVIRQKITINANVLGMDLVIVQTTKTQLKDIDKKGNLVWEQTVESVTLNDMAQTEIPPAQTQTRDKQNKLVEFKPLEAGGNPFSPEVQKLMAATSEIILTDKEVKPGESWTTEFENPIVKEKKVAVKTTFVGMDKVEGKEYWKVKQTATAETDAAGAKSIADMTAWLDPADGSMFKMEGSVKDIPIEQAGPISWTMKMEKLKAEKTDKAEKAP